MAIETNPNDTAFAITYSKPGHSPQVVAAGITEEEAHEILKLVAHDHRQVVAAPPSVTTPEGDVWAAVPMQ